MSHRARYLWMIWLMMSGLCVPRAQAAEPDRTPKIVPQTRPEMKTLLERLKQRTPRLPLPELVPETGTGDLRSTVNNGRMRNLYLPTEWQSTSSTNRNRTAPNAQGNTASRTPSYANNEPGMTLDYAFKTRLFWLVSRLNNCQYCLGHQEHKLHTAGMDDDSIAALDSDWSVFPPAEQAAFEFTRRLTSFPHEFADADINALRPHFNETQIVELVQTVAGYNSTNRWTDSLGIPQDNGFGDRKVELDTPTSEKYQKRPSIVFPKAEKPRGEWEPREAVLAAFEVARNREPRVNLLSDAAAREALKLSNDAPLPTWQQAQAYFPQSAQRQGEHRKAVAEFGRISPRTKARIMWTVARENRAWYSAQLARATCHKLGLTDDELLTPAEMSGAISAGDQAVIAFARKLTSKPRQITDADMFDLLKHFSAAETAEVVYVVCLSNSFDRFTEALGLKIEI